MLDLSACSRYFHSATNASKQKTRFPRRKRGIHRESRFRSEPEALVSPGFSHSGPGRIPALCGGFFAVDWLWLLKLFFQERSDSSRTSNDSEP
jgi:hypothetical protein